MLVAKSHNYHVDTSSTRECFPLLSTWNRPCTRKACLTEGDGEL